jgi:hypothetical protein
MGWFRDFLKGRTRRSIAQAGVATTSAPAARLAPAASDDVETLEEFARRSFKSVVSRDISLREVGRLIELLIDATMADHPGVDKQTVLSSVMAGLSVFCPRCGQFTENAVAMLAMANEPIMQKAVFGGPNAASLAQSRCPHCGGTTAKAVFDPTKMAT